MAIYKITKQKEERIERDCLLIRARDALNDLILGMQGFELEGTLRKYEALLEEINIAIGRPTK